MTSMLLVANIRAIVADSNFTIPKVGSTKWSYEFFWQ